MTFAQTNQPHSCLGKAKLVLSWLTLHLCYSNNFLHLCGYETSLRSFITLLIILDGDEMIMMLVTTDDNEDSWWPSVLRLRFQLSLDVFKCIEFVFGCIPVY